MLKHQLKIWDVELLNHLFFLANLVEIEMVWIYLSSRLSIHASLLSSSNLLRKKHLNKS